MNRSHLFTHKNLHSTLTINTMHRFLNSILSAWNTFNSLQTKGSYLNLKQYMNVSI